MNYAKLIDKLYNGTLEDILTVLNKAIYVTDFIPKTDDSIIIHTGFTFSTQHKKMILLYEFETEKIIKQVFNNHPNTPLRINGLCLKPGTSEYLNGYMNAMVFTASITDNRFCELYKIAIKEITRYSSEDNIREITCSDDDGKDVLISYIRITDDEGTLQSIPLSKVLNHRFYFDGFMFHLDKFNRIKFEKNADRESFGSYAGSWAQDVEGLSDDYINDVLDGEPDAYWNID